MKSLFKSKKKFPTPSVPREALAINTAYSQLCAELGQLQYSAYVQGKRIDRLKEAILELDLEMNARQELDKANKPVETASTEQAQ